MAVIVRNDTFVVETLDMLPGAWLLRVGFGGPPLIGVTLGPLVALELAQALVRAAMVILEDEERERRTQEGG